MKLYKCPHCLGKATPYITSEKEVRVECKGDRECNFEGTEDEFEIYDDMIIEHLKK